MERTFMEQAWFERLRRQNSEMPNSHGDGGDGGPDLSEGMTGDPDTNADAAPNS